MQGKLKSVGGIVERRIGTDEVLEEGADVGGW